jgi:hypothetical protein
VYHRNRDENQKYSIYLGVEKKTMLQQLRAWFDRYGVAIISLGGYSSQTYVDDVADDINDRDRPGVLIYSGDFDPSGIDILRDFKDRCDSFADVQRIALNAAQVTAYNLPVNAGKSSDTRAAGFVRDYGELVQVELEALAPETLRQLYDEALSKYYDLSTYEAVIETEKRDADALRKFTGVE